MATACAGLGDSQVKLCYESRLVAASAGPGGSVRPAVACLRRIGSCEAGAKMGHSYVKEALGGVG